MLSFIAMMIRDHLSTEIRAGRLSLLLYVSACNHREGLEGMPLHATRVGVVRAAAAGIGDSVGLQRSHVPGPVPPVLGFACVHVRLASHQASTCRYRHASGARHPSLEPIFCVTIPRKVRRCALLAFNVVEC